MKSFTAETEWESLKLAAEYMEGNALGINHKKMTVEQAFTQYIEARNNILSPATIRGYRIIRDSRLQLIKDICIRDLNLNDIQRAVNFDAQRLSVRYI